MTLILATILLGLAVALGAILAIRSLRAARLAPTFLAAAHGLVALGGWILLLAALRGPARGVATGTASFGAIAAILLGAAALAGVALFATRARGARFRGGLIGIHATLAVSGFVILLVYALLA